MKEYRSPEVVEIRKLTFETQASGPAIGDHDSHGDTESGGNGDDKNGMQ